MAALARGMRTLAVAAILLVAVVSCTASGNSTNDGGIGSAASCAAMLKFRHEVYIGTSLRNHPPYNRIGVIPVSHLRKLGIAVQPPCLDTNHPGTSDSAAAVQVARIDGVSPKIAIAALPRGNVYLRPGAKIPRILTTAHWVHWYFSD